MDKIVVANCNKILNDIQHQLVLKYNAISYTQKEELKLESLEQLKPDYIFFLHWSWIIPKEIFNTYNCVVFHMTDLPYGRGGSPLQNLIIRGHKETKISALKVDEGIDTGDIYLKKNLSLQGTATEIFLNAGKVIEEMINEIIELKLEPVKQKGNPVLFSRRKPAESLISPALTKIENLYDFIRMLDAENYPHAFLENDNFKFEFTDARITKTHELLANVRIIKK